MVLFLPKLILKVERLTSSLNPIALRTLEGLIFPELHAGPFETAISALSSLAIKILEFFPGKEILIKPGKLSVL